MPKVNVKDYYTFEEAKRVVKQLNIKNFREWCVYISPRHLEYDEKNTGSRRASDKSKEKKPHEMKDPRLPSDPATFYKRYGQKWNGWADFLGTENQSPSQKKFIPYDQAASLVKKLELTTKNDYKEFVRTTGFVGLPISPESYYTSDKRGEDAIDSFSWREFLAPKFVTFEEARTFARSLPGVNTFAEWTKFCSSGAKPDRIPSSPPTTYKKDWISWPDFLGTDHKPKPKLKRAK